MIQKIVIVAAAESIHQLEKRNARLVEERDANQIRITAFEKVYMNMRARHSMN